MTASDLCVICNGKAGQGMSRSLLRGLRRALGGRAEVRLTQAPGHAEELALEAGRAGFAVVGAAGGDGTVNQVANGLLRAGRTDVVLAVFPAGSANDYAYSLGLKPGWWRRWLRGESAVRPRAVDVGLVEAPGGRTRYFVNGLGLGFNAAVALERDRTPWLRGVPLYSVSLFTALCFRFHQPRMKVTLETAGGTLVRHHPTLALSVAVGRREGSFLLAPRAELDDGQFDYLQAGALRRWELVRHFPGLITGHLPADHPELWTGRCRRVSVESEAALAVHLDGEFFSRPADGVRRLEVSIVPGALRVQILLT